MVHCKHCNGLRSRSTIERAKQFCLNEYEEKSKPDHKEEAQRDFLSCCDYSAVKRNEKLSKVFAFLDSSAYKEWPLIITSQGKKGKRAYTVFALNTGSPRHTAIKR